MTEYKESDRTEANKVTGKDEFGTGQTTGWTHEDNKLSMSGTGLRYVPKSGTDANTAVLEGVDVIFMGIYNDDYKPELDDVRVDLNVKNTCLDEETENTTPGGTTEAPAPDQSNEQGTQQQENTTPQEGATPPAAPKKPENKQPENKQPEKKPEVEKATSS